MIEDHHTELPAEGWLCIKWGIFHVTDLNLEVVGRSRANGEGTQAQGHVACDLGGLTCRKPRNIERKELTQMSLIFF